MRHKERNRSGSSQHDETDIADNSEVFQSASVRSSTTWGGMGSMSRRVKWWLVFLATFATSAVLFFSIVGPHGSTFARVSAGILAGFASEKLADKLTKDD